MDILDVRDLIERYEELETIRDEAAEEESQSDGLDEAETGELAALKELLEDLRGSGGDEQWRGDWYPLTLIPERDFKEYAQELAEDCGLVPDNLAWPCTCIDWDQAASELEQDYSGVRYQGTDYLYR